ncbi:hypothetical protein Q3G72_022464 [Acer saccharum]|nr:hypothetical protein Q3G72_022464 [Acer saccharum]
MNEEVLDDTPKEGEAPKAMMLAMIALAPNAAMLFACLKREIDWLNVGKLNDERGTDDAPKAGVLEALKAERQLRFPTPETQLLHLPSPDTFSSFSRISKERNITTSLFSVPVMYASSPSIIGLFFATAKCVPKAGVLKAPKVGVLKSPKAEN